MKHQLIPEHIPADDLHFLSNYLNSSFEVVREGAVTFGVSPVNQQRYVLEDHWHRILEVSVIDQILDSYSD